MLLYYKLERETGVYSFVFQRLIGRGCQLEDHPQSGKWVLPERHGIPYWLLWQLNDNKIRRAKFYASSVDYITSS